MFFLCVVCSVRLRMIKSVVIVILSMVIVLMNLGVLNFGSVSVFVFVLNSVLGSVNSLCGVGVGIVCVV